MNIRSSFAYINEAFFTFQGRVGRLAFLVRMLVLFAAIAAIPITLDFAGASSDFHAVYVLPLGVLLLASCYSLIARRFHDLNMSGLWALIFVASAVVRNMTRTIDIPELTAPLFLAIAMVEIGALLTLLFMPGTKGLNRFNGGKAPPVNPNSAIARVLEAGRFR